MEQRFTSETLWTTMATTIPYVLLDFYIQLVISPPLTLCNGYRRVDTLNLIIPGDFPRDSYSVCEGKVMEKILGDRYTTSNYTDFPSFYVCSLSCALSGPLLKKTFLKMKLKSSSSLSEPAVRAQLLSQLQSALVQRGFSDMMLQWSQPPKQEVMRKEAAPGGKARQAYCTK
ncbi:hypothetical protein cypCar_00045111 [Cyprinus carpio]|nr:hypothetical protein cypCar_00045111 [Cyprinus carpio]